ncbi:MAG: DUF1657 domain-containing protein [Firmicutes bacterium]|nr:DUF1657 domain-containing protein [Bacillota bacterium]
MTVANKLATTLANAESVAASLKSFALETEDQQAKQMFQQLAQSMDNTVSQLRNRLDYIMQEEPQYASEIQPAYGSTIIPTQNNVVHDNSQSPQS